jgi:hypothetical protein
MVLKRGLKLSLILAIFIVCQGSGAVNFGERRSAIKISDGATLNIQTGLTVDQGSIVKKTVDSNITSDGALVGITFDGGILESSKSEGLLTAFYNPTGYYDTIYMQGGGHRLRAEPGRVLQKVSVSGSDNTIEGQPTFLQDIEMTDVTTSLTLGIQTSLNKHLLMGGGTVHLSDDLKLGDDILFKEGGTVILKDKQFTFGGKDLSWTSTIFWDHASDMVLNNKISLTSTWSFYGESHVVGNGNVLDLTDGVLWVKHDTTLHLKDIKIKGWSDGCIVLEDKTSQIRFSDVEVEMNAAMTLTTGGIYVEGPTTIITKSYLLTFDQAASLTVDGVTLWYDPLYYGDKENIRPEVPFDYDDLATGGNSTNISLKNGGLIRLKANEGGGAGEEIGDLYYNDPGEVVFTHDMFLSADRRMFVNADMVIDGNHHYIQFTKWPTDLTPQIIVAAGKTLEFRNIVLKDFDEEHIGGVGKENVVFSYGTVIEMATDETLHRTWTFSGYCELNGQGNYLDFSSLGNIVVSPRYSYLYFRNISLENVDRNAIRCIHNSSGLGFENSRLMLDGTYTFSMGYFEVVDGDLVVSGTGMFVYETPESSFIDYYAKLFLDTGITFSYAPRSASKDLIEFYDERAKLHLNGATLNTTLTGMRLTRGTLVLDHNNFMYNQDGDDNGATSISQAIVFGDGLLSNNDIHIEIMPGGSLDLKEGILDYNNVN